MSEALQKLYTEREKIDELISELENDDNESGVETLQEMRSRLSKLPKLVRYETGVDWFDRNTGGITQGSLVNIAGESTAGKTTFALLILEKIARFNQVYFFSFEMYERVLNERTEHLTDKQAQNIIVGQKVYNIDAIEKEIRKRAADGVVFFAIDSNMKISAAGIQDDWKKKSVISDRLSKLVQELGIIIIMINQIAEDDLKTGRLQLKGSGDQMYDADMVLFIILERDKDKNQTGNRLMACTKHRLKPNHIKEKWVQEIPDISKPVEEVTHYEMPPGDIL